MHLCLLAGAYESDAFGVLARQVFGGSRAHCGYAHVGAECTVHDANRVAVYDIGQNNDGTEVLGTIFYGVFRKY
ncbi:hypothetical protein SDC9_160450 [bioreactor metagenome]|uniref:Uncharacterized protein n=1 Tax=bioreactor metagenome TaxID=1076179 RepID=A0A645FGP2_9ZZZZ